MFQEIIPTQYVLQSVKTGREFVDAGWTLDAPGETEPALVRAVYKEKKMNPKDLSLGVFRFSDWLPVQRFLKGSAAPITYKSEGLAKVLSLKNLYITFSGYFPEKGAHMSTCSFKETEAYSVCGRITDKQKGVLVVASAGNTARAFARVCSDNNIPLVLCVPEDNLNALWFDRPIADCVRLFSTCSGSDYYDAIHLSNLICSLPGYYAEGGAKNVARRDGMGTTVLSAAEVMGKIPDFYFQAVGSGTGAIAAWEANLRLIEDGRFGANKMKLMISQNAPFLPIFNAWKNNSRNIPEIDDQEARRQVEEIEAKVLSNRKPPYSICGGLYDALIDCGGNVLFANNKEAEVAANAFEISEGIDIHPAAAIATFTLFRQVLAGNIPEDAYVMLNITGGGEKRFIKDKTLCYLKPTHIFDFTPSIEEVEKILSSS